MAFSIEDSHLSRAQEVEYPSIVCTTIHVAKTSIDVDRSPAVIYESSGVKVVCVDHGGVVSSVQEDKSADDCNKLTMEDGYVTPNKLHDNSLWASNCRCNQFVL